MNSAKKYLLVGAIIGGLLPGLLHPLGITVFATTTDIFAHAVSTAIGTLFGFLIFKSKA